MIHSASIKKTLALVGISTLMLPLTGFTTNLPDVNFQLMEKSYYIGANNQSILEIEDDELEPEDYRHVEVLTRIFNLLNEKSVEAYQDDRRDCITGGVRTGTGGEERKMEGRIKGVFLHRGYRSRGNVTVAVFRLAVQGSSWQKGFICVGSEYNRRTEDFTGDAYVKVKYSNGLMAVQQIQVRNDHWGMMKEA
ncbi:MAG: hypothetical protein F6K10_22900, partial [Moorea sp. SIO2B7]|nr:hypothetical protein [Moorena sp. SIO2B7]